MHGAGIPRRVKVIIHNAFKKKKEDCKSAPSFYKIRGRKKITQKNYSMKRKSEFIACKYCPRAHKIYCFQEDCASERERKSEKERESATVKQREEIDSLWLMFCVLMRASAASYTLTHVHGLGNHCIYIEYFSTKNPTVFHTAYIAHDTYTYVMQHMHTSYSYTCVSANTTVTNWFYVRRFSNCF